MSRAKGTAEQSRCEGLRANVIAVTFRPADGTEGGSK